MNDDNSTEIILEPDLSNDFSEDEIQILLEEFPSLFSHCSVQSEDESG